MFCTICSLRIAHLKCGPAVISLLIHAVLAGCVTTDLTDAAAGAGAASLDLYPMSNSQNSTRCVIRAIDGIDVSGEQSERLTSKYLLPSGLHRFTFLCEESIGSIAMRNFRFELDVAVKAGASYGLMQRVRAGAPACIVFSPVNPPALASDAAVEYCPLVATGEN